MKENFNVLDSYDVFKQSIYSLSTIDLNSYKERQMKRRIEALITKRGINSFEEYVKLIKSDKAAYDEFINYITINVSEFYRNPEQWETLEKDILPYLIKNFGKKLKIWSAACSTGDEPYSLVMLLSKYIPTHNIKILATDIDRLVMEKAKTGLYNEKYLKTLPEEFIKLYFNKVDDKTYKISNDIINCVEFNQHDLLRDPYPSDCDLIICRNVLIYFTDEAKKQIYKGFHKSLKKGGLLFVGSTEQIIQSQQIGFSTVKSFFYSKL